MGSDRRIGPHFLYAGPGYGGSCFPKDVSAVAALADDHGRELTIVRAAANANTKQQDYVFDRIASLFPDGLAKKVIAVWGLAFKPETDDVRESPAGRLVQRLTSLGATIHAHDPEAAANFAATYAPDAKYFDSEYDCVDGADALVVMTEWRHFRNPDTGELKRRMRSPKIVDTRNIWSMFNLNDHGFEYRGVGTAAGRRR
jgi:UDPglucose 6-dehydrogenase